MPNEDQFIASMRLYQHDDGVNVVALIKTAADEEEQEVLVPPHMAAMLPQAVAMVKMQANG